MCTTFRLRARDSAVIVGRTMEFAADLGWRLLVVPRGTALTGTAPDGPGRAFAATYGFVGVGALGRLAATDGLNEAGLYAGLLYLPGYAEYQDATGVPAGDLVSPDEVAALVLAGAATVAEAVEIIESVTVWNRLEEALGGAILPIHLVLHDRAGNAVVVEWVGGVRTVHDNPVGVATNSPPFDWHLTNLRNYVNLRATNVDPLALDGLTLTAIGEGSGLLGLPGDWTPPSRFVRATAIAQATEEIDDGPTAVGAALHIANAFDIPKGVVRDPHGGDYTAWISVSDLANGRYVLRTYGDPTPRSIALADLDLSPGAPVRQLELPSEPTIPGFAL